MSANETKYLRTLTKRRNYLRQMSDQHKSNTYEDAERVALTWAVAFIKEAMETNAQ